MKKLILPLAITLSIVSCSKEKNDNCRWYDSIGNGWYDHPPTAQEKAELEQQCACTVTFSMECE